MSGFLGTSLGTPMSIGAAALAAPGEFVAPPHRGTPAVALLASGALHAAALALILLASARSEVEPVRTIGIAVFVQPVDVVRLEPPPEVAAPARSNDRDGVIHPVPPTEAPPEAEIQFDPKGFGGVSPISGVSPPDAKGGPPAKTFATTPSTESDATYDEPPVPTNAPEPIYPEIARDAGIEGRVFLKLLVTRDGSVGDLRVQEGNAILAAAAAKALRLWRFRPARRNGQPVSAWVVVPVLFKLQ